MLSELRELRRPVSRWEVDGDKNWGGGVARFSLLVHPNAAVISLYVSTKKISKGLAFIDTL